MKLRNVSGLSMMVLAAVNGLVFAADNAHVHGHSTIKIAAEKTADAMEIMAEVNIPGMDLIGFEHRPSNDQEKNALEEAIERLLSDEAVLAWPRETGCVLKLSEVADSERHDEHSGDEHGHADEEETHSEHVANLMYSCSLAQPPRSLRITLFERFASVEEVDVQFITESGQGAFEVDADDPVIDLGDLFD